MLLSPAPPPEHEPFLRAVVDRPDDDFPRLVYADFLEESGDPELIARAHFIRAQIAIESLPPRSKDAVETQAFIERLDEMFMETFQFELPLWLVNEADILYRRGFLDTITITEHRLATQGADLFHNFPISGVMLRSSLNISHIEHGWLTRLPFLERVSLFGFESNFMALARYPSQDDNDDDDGTPFFQELMSTPVLKKLRTLVFRGSRIDDAWLVRFVSLLDRAAFAHTLRELDFTDCLLIGDAGANTLATARGLDHLTRLTLKNLSLNETSRSMLRRRFQDRVEF